MTDPITRLNAALESRYRVEREIGEGGMTVADGSPRPAALEGRYRIEREIGEGHILVREYSKRWR